MTGNSKLYTYILIGLLGVSGLLYILFVLGAINEGLLINWCYLLFGIAAIVSITFPLIGMAKDFKRVKSSLIGVGVLVVIFGISMALASDEVYKVDQMVIDGAVSARSEAGLITFYIMMGLAVAAIVYTEISKAFK